MRASNFSSGGYSTDKYNDLVGNKKVHILIGRGLIPQQKFVDGKRTDEIDAMKVGIYIEGVGADMVKLPATFELESGIKDMSVIQFDNPEACDVRGNIYFRASGIKQAK